MSKTALVTGATGFIGHHVCNRLYNSDYRVIAVGTQGENKPKCHQFLQINLDGIPWDLVPEIDVCFHQAANNDTTDLDTTNMLRSNLSAPMNLFYRLAEEKKCKQFVYASSCSVYGKQPVPYVERKTKPQPLNPYAESKLLFEQFTEEFAIEYKVNCVGLRYSNVYGPGEKHKGKRASMIHQLLHRMAAGQRPKLFNYGEQLRDWVYIEDVVEANMLSSQYKHSNVFNVGAGESMSFNNVVNNLNIALGTWLEPEYIPCPFLDAYQDHTLLDMAHAAACLGFKPKYTIVEGIAKFVEETKKATT
jgi:ADP-L-glycero-D-manno-heptose-6-epimerase